MIKDITEMMLLEQNLKKSEEIHRLLADNANDVLWVMDLSGIFSYVSPSVEKLRGFTVEEVMDQTREELLCPGSLIYFEKGLEGVIHRVQNSEPITAFRGELEQPCKDGTTVWTDVTVSGMYNPAGHFVGLLGVSRDVTEKREMAETIKRLSETDLLTQLNNRVKLHEVLCLELARLSRCESVCSVIFLDIDHFKQVNDTYGHLVGDSVLKEMARILATNTRLIDTVGRWGGEEFLIILPLTDVKGAEFLAEKLRRTISEYNFTSVGHLSASFGVADTTKCISMNELINSADAALYHAKETGRNQVCCAKR